MTWTTRVLATLAVALALTCVFSTAPAFAQRPPDPLLSPQEGGNGSRFQIVGQSGWTPGEQVTIRLGLATADPLSFAGPYYHDRQVTVLRDGTWSFPINVNDELFPFPLGTAPGFIVVQAESPTKTAVNAFVYSPGGARPAGADAIASLGFGPEATTPVFALTVALFAAATGGLLVLSGAGRRVRL